VENAIQLLVSLKHHFVFVVLRATLSPFGASSSRLATHGLRRELHSYASSRLRHLVLQLRHLRRLQLFHPASLAGHSAKPEERNQ
jgi:hypothetical protein